MKNYRILDARGCGIHKQGDVVEGHQIGDEHGIAYLLKNDIVEETADPISQSLPDGKVAISANAIAEAGASLQGKIDEAVAEATKALEVQLDAVKLERDDLVKKVAAFEKDLGESQESLTKLRAKHNDLKEKHEALKSKKG